jgi:hypothetical protein
MTEPILTEIKTGWAALGQGWAVHAATRDEALRRFREAEREHREILARPYYYERTSTSRQGEEQERGSLDE